MITFKCKMCGGDLEFEQGATVVECPYCGSKQTLPKLDNDRRANMYDRANHFRRQNEYDKAMAIYEQILQEDRTDAEAYWSLVLCRYGIEYVEDPGTNKRIPTVNRMQYASILADEDYQSALQYADSVQRSVYESEANAIAEIQKGILDISKAEKPFDVFICYKETDANGRRTPDSVLANDLYHQLTNEGFKVFFARITLEDKIGSAYEPYIFAALNSAKVMVVLGTKPEYFNAVWVKNEWSRYLALIRSGADKVLVPAYRDMDPYDLPDEFSHLQAQDMGKLGFMQDLIRGIKKITSKDEAKPQPVVQQTVVSGGATVDSLMKRARLFMEDGDFTSASEYLDKVLDVNPEYAPAYAAKACVAFGLRKESGLAESTFQYEDNPDWQKALRFADPQLKATYESYAAKVKERVTKQIRDYAYDCAIEMAVSPDADRSKLDAELAAYQSFCNHSTGERPDGSRRANSQAREDAFNRAVKTNEPGDVSESCLKTAAEMFDVIGDAEASERAKQCRELAEQARQKAIYLNAVKMQNEERYSASGLQEAAKLYLTIPNYKDAKAKAEECANAAETKRQEDAKAQREAEAAAAKKKRNTIIGILMAVFVIAIVLVVTKVIVPGNRYRDAVALQQAGKYEEAITAFEELNGYSDSVTQISETKYLKARLLLEKGDYSGAEAIFVRIKGYKDVNSLLANDNNLVAAAVAAAPAREARIASFRKVGGYVTFGTYPQTKEGNDNTPIEWLVLDYDADNNCALLLSRYGLDAQPYNTSGGNTTWEKCTLRTWLNGTFLKKAFTTEEQATIMVTAVDNSKSQGYYRSTEGGNNTQDKVFLLSYAEAWRYFTNDKSRRCSATDYANAHGAMNSSGFPVDGNDTAPWWLRSPARRQNSAMALWSGDSESAWLVEWSGGMVRPALWINLQSGIV